MALHAETVAVQRVVIGPPRADGTAQKTTTSTDIKRCQVTPVGTEESIGEESPITSRWRVSTKRPEDWIRSRDRVVWRGRVHEVQGRPQTFWGVKPHTEFIITETKG
jgi:hypothetical protein